MKTKNPKEIKILYEGIFHTTPKKLHGALHDFWLSRVPSLAGTPIDGMVFDDLYLFDEYFSRIYIRIGQDKLGIIAYIDIRCPNDDLMIAICGSKGQDELSRATEKFLLDFAAFLEARPRESMQVPPANMSDMEKVRYYSRKGEHTIEQIARKVSISVATVKRYRKKWE